MLTEQLHLTPTSDGIYERQCDRVWWGQGSLLGGYIQSLMLSAMTNHVADESKAALTLHTQFLRPVTDHTIRIEVTEARRGRTLSNLRASLYCDDRLAVVATGLFGQHASRHDFSDIDMPTYPGIGSTEPPQQPNVGLDAHQHFDFFPRIGNFERGKGQAHVAGWLRPTWEHTLDNALLSLVADLWVPAAFHYWPDTVGVVGLDSYIQFRSHPTQLRQLHQSPHTCPPLFLSLDTKQASHGYVDEDGLIWSHDGVLLCQYRQMRLVLAQ